MPIIISKNGKDVKRVITTIKSLLDTLKEESSGE